jgi:S1-C subfamily serine protease
MMRLLAGVNVILSMLLLCGYGYVYTYNYLPDALPPLVLPEQLQVADAPPEAVKNTFPQPARVTGITAYVSSNAGLGTCVVIDSQTVLTVAHVVAKQKMVFVDVGRNERRWVPARVIGRIDATGEDIIILQIVGDKDGFYNKKNFKMGTGIKLPRWLVTPKGVFDWNSGVIVPGDSGGAVLNNDGELIGLVTGYLTLSRENIATFLK